MMSFLMASRASAANKPNELPPGPAKATVEAKCKQCHDLKRITNQHQNAQWWSLTLDKMVERGLEIEPDEQQQLVKYLSKNFGVKSGSKAAK
jgi:hypothetical protein